MKVVSWNCNGALRKKAHLIDRLSADLLIVQECENPALSEIDCRDWAGDFLWKGKNKNKGIGVFKRGNFSLSDLSWDDHGLESFLPFSVNEKLNFVAVWTKYANSPTFPYIGQLWKYILFNKEKFINSQVIICGDFNSNAIWDKWDRWWNHSDVVRELEEIGIVSMYHHQKLEEQGSETEPTFYLQRNLEKSYHIDYAFSSVQIIENADFKFEVGRQEDWISASDHMPILFEIPF
jgi:exonuclease III